MRRVLPLALLLLAPPAWAADRLDDEGTSQGYINAINCVGAGISCTRSGITGTLTVSGGGSSHAILSATHTDALAGTVVRGDLIIGNATPAWARTALGANNTFLGSNGTDAAWTATSGTGLAVGTGRTLTGGVGIAALGDLSADRTVTLDLTELSTATLGTGAFTTLTFDAGATDPVLTAGNATLTIAPGGSDLIVTDDVELRDATPSLQLTPTGGEKAHWGAEVVGTRTISFLGDATSGLQHFIMDFTENADYFPQLPNCSNGIATNGTGRASCHTPLLTKCGTFANLVAADDNVVIFAPVRSVTIKEAICKTSGFTTLPTLTLENDNGTAMTSDLSCSATTGRTSWFPVTASNTLVVGQALRFDTTNTTVPITGTQTMVCVSYTES